MRRFLFSSLTIAALSLMLVACNPNAQAKLSEKPIENQPQKLDFTVTAQVKDKTWKVAVAATPEQQQMGLMFRTSLPDDEAMLFPFNPPRPVAFWMKHTLIPLDMLYIAKGVIQEIQTQVPPCQKDPCPSYPSKSMTIDQVVEIRGGLAQELGLKSGDRITFTPIVPTPVLTP
jgi:uncharacterized protein